MRYEYTHFIPQNVAPKGATKIIVKDGDGKEVGSIPASRFGGLARPAGEPDYSFGLVSDCHTFLKDTNWDGQGKLRRALSYFGKAGCRFVIGCGDFTQTGFYRKNESGSSITAPDGSTVANGEVYFDNRQMSAYSEILAESPIPVYELFGNHENYHGKDITLHLDLAKEYTGIPHTAYTVSSAADSDTVTGTTVRPNRQEDVEDDLYILIGQSTSSQVMSADDFTWLSATLAANADRRCFVFIHSYMEEDSGDAGDYRENSIFDTWGATKTANFIALLERYSNVILFHGHSHMKLEYQNIDPEANYAEVMGYKSVHVPSLGAPRGIDETANNHTPEDLRSSQCYRVDVYPDCIVLNGLELGTTGVPSVVVLGTLKINT